MIRVVLPAHLRTLAGVQGEVELDVVAAAAGGAVQESAGGPIQASAEVPGGAVTQRLVLDTLEARYPVLRGTIRDRATGKRRAFVRFFACEQDLSHEDPDTPLPDAVAAGTEPYLIVGAMAGG